MESELTKDYWECLDQWIEEFGNEDLKGNALISTALAEVDRLNAIIDKSNGVDNHKTIG